MVLMNLNEPDRWFFDSLNEQNHSTRVSMSRQNIEWEGQVCRELSENAVEAVRGAVGHFPHVERIYQDDPRTIVIHWYDNVEGEGGTSSVSGRRLRRARDTIATLFGDCWRVERKRDGRFRKDKHPQKAVVRRIEAQRFRYPDESRNEWLIALHGRPDDIPGDVTQWGDMEQYQEPDYDHRPKIQADLYVYAAPSGTKHLIPARRLPSEDKDGLRAKSIHDGPSAYCGTQPTQETMADGDRLVHYSECVRDADGARYDTVISEYGPLAPKDLLDDDGLCARCWSVYSDDEGTAPLPGVKYRELVGDDDE